MVVDPGQALSVGALAAEILAPKDVVDLEAFFSLYPQFVAEVEAALGFTPRVSPELFAALPVGVPTQPEEEAGEEEGDLRLI